MPEELDVQNRQRVTEHQGSIVVLHATTRMSPEQALVHAAYLILEAEPVASVPFADVLEAVRAAR